MSPDVAARGPAWGWPRYAVFFPNARPAAPSEKVWYPFLDVIKNTPVEERSDQDWLTYTLRTCRATEVGKSVILFVDEYEQPAPVLKTYDFHVWKLPP